MYLFIQIVACSFNHPKEDMAKEKIYSSWAKSKQALNLAARSEDITTEMQIISRGKLFNDKNYSINIVLKYAK